MRERTSLISRVKKAMGAAAIVGPILMASSAFAQHGGGGIGHLPKIRAQVNQVYAQGQRLRVGRLLQLPQYNGWKLEHLIVRGIPHGGLGGGGGFGGGQQMKARINLIIDQQQVASKVLRMKPNGKPSRVKFDIPPRLQKIIFNGQGQRRPIQIKVQGAAFIKAVLGVVSKDDVIALDQRLVYQGGAVIPVKRELRLGQISQFAQITKVGAVAFSPGGRGTLTLVQGQNYASDPIALPSRKIVNALNIKGKLVDFDLAHSQGRIQFHTTGKVIVNGLYAEVKEYAGQ